jgi:hypothetical protein
LSELCSQNAECYRYTEPENKKIKYSLLFCVKNDNSSHGTSRDGWRGDNHDPKAENSIAKYE